MSDYLATGGLVRGEPVIVGDTGPEPFVIWRKGERIVRWPHDLSHPRERRRSFCPVPWHWPDPNPFPRFHLFGRRQ